MPNLGPSWTIDDLNGLVDPHRLLHTLLDQVPDFIVILDLDGRILFINRVMVGFDDVRGTDGFNYVDPECRDTMRAAMVRVVETGRATEYPAHGPDASGQRRYYHSRIAPIIRDGKVVA